MISQRSGCGLPETGLPGARAVTVQSTQSLQKQFAAVFHTYRRVFLSGSWARGVFVDKNLASS